MKMICMAAAVCLAVAAGAAEKPLPRCDLVSGWAQTGPTRSYVADTLYDYMDGNSEGYLIYGFKSMSGVTCNKDGASFVVDISEMPDAELAYGMFASNRDPRVPVEPIGMEAQVVPQRGFFAKGNRFVEISASPTSMDHSVAIRQFLKALAGQIDGSAEKPAPVHWFPPEKLDGVSIRMVPQSVLGLSILKRGWMASYEFGRAFVVPETSAESASSVMATLRKRFANLQPVEIGDEAFTGTDRYLGRMLVFRTGAKIGGFSNIAEGADLIPAAQQLLGRTQAVK